MNYAVSIEIEKPIGEVVEIMNDEDNLYKWMPGLESLKLLEGEKGKQGAKTEMIFDNKGRKMTMVETILENQLPESFIATYDAPSVHNIIRMQFYDKGDGKTEYVQEQEFRLSGFMKIFGWFGKSIFKKQSMFFLFAFKRFVETGETANQ